MSELYSVEDKNRLEYFRHLVSPTQSEMDEIFMLYNRYAGTMVSYNTSCNCTSSIQNIYWALLAWFSANYGKFK